MSSSVKLDRIVLKKEPTRLRNSPAGPSEREWYFEKTVKSDGAVCQICGSEHTERVTVTSFMHRKLVIECCGKLLDDAFVELGFLFCAAFLRDYSLKAKLDLSESMEFTLKE